MALRLVDPLLGLSTLADLGGGRPPGEALRSCALATALAGLVGDAEARDEPAGEIELYERIAQRFPEMTQAREALRQLKGG